MKKILGIVFIGLGLCACNDEAQVASYNISKDADNFGIIRRIVFYNGITNEYILSITGLCSISAGSSIPKEIAVTCKTGPNEYKKHFLGVSDNVTFFAEQLEPSHESVYHYEVVFKPSTIIPDIRIK